MVTCYYALALLALNGRLYEESERCLARAERLDKRLRSGIMETRRNDGSHYTKDEHGRFTGSTSAGGFGGKITDKNYTQIEKFEEQAEQFYRARIDEGTKDVEMIASNTGFSRDDIQAIKDHVMVEDHLFSDGTVRKFDPDIDQALAWQRLMENRFTDMDILLLNHELRELRYMKQHQCDYETAHAYATQKYDWQSAVDAIVDSDDIDQNLL